jgi:hypothetical protein
MPYECVVSEVALFGLSEPSLPIAAATPSGGLAYQLREFLQAIAEHKRSDSHRSAMTVVQAPLHKSPFIVRRGQASLGASRRELESVSRGREPRSASMLAAVQRWRRGGSFNPTGNGPFWRASRRKLKSASRGAGEAGRHRPLKFTGSVRRMRLIRCFTAGSRGARSRARSAPIWLLFRLGEWGRPFYPRESEKWTFSGLSGNLGDNSRPLGERMIP